MTTIPTGQGECVALAEFVTQKITASIPNVETYIDNIRYTGTIIEDATELAQHLQHTTKHLNATVNEQWPLAVYQTSSMDEPSSYTFRGIEFYKQSTDEMVVTRARLGAKTIAKLKVLRDCLTFTNSPTNWWYPPLSEWVHHDLEAAFGLCVYGSCALMEPLYKYYYIFKHVRRRSYQISTGRRTEEEPAAIWESIIPLWLQWVDALISKTVGTQDFDDKLAQGPQQILITDASPPPVRR